MTLFFWGEKKSKMFRSSRPGQRLQKSVSSAGQRCSAYEIRPSNDPHPERTSSENAAAKPSASSLLYYMVPRDQIKTSASSGPRYVAGAQPKSTTTPKPSSSLFKKNPRSAKPKQKTRQTDASSRKKSKRILEDEDEGGKGHDLTMTDDEEDDDEEDDGNDLDGFIDDTEYEVDYSLYTSGHADE